MAQPAGDAVRPGASLPPLGQPLSAAVRQRLDSLPNEATPEPRLHYFRSNEWRQDLLRPLLAGRGGAYIGVGSDQNYTMAAMAGSELLLLVDFDPRIRLVHPIYGALVSASENPDALIARFSEEALAESEALIRNHLEGHAQVEEAVRHFKRHRATWLAYLRRVQGLVRDGRPFSWLADPALYDHVRRLHREGRIISRTGDVTADVTLRAMGDTARALGATVRTIYFSNAEQFFEYTAGFKQNMHNLPTDERTVVVRTIRGRMLQIAEDGRWHYMVHDFPDFMTRLDSGAYRRSFALVADLLAAGPPHHGADGISTMTAETPRPMMDRLVERRRERQARR